MSVLSEWDIIAELGKRIFFYPFEGKDKSISGCSLCLTASEYAYTFDIETRNYTKLGQKETITEGKKPEYFILPPKKTSIIWTEESILLKDYFCGSIHSKVKLVSRGIGHIGTRINPNYGGVLAIALHNTSENEIRIDIGETIAYVQVYKLNSESSTSLKKDNAGKLKDTIPEGVPAPTELNDWIANEEWRKGDEQSIKKILTNSEKYNEAKEELRSRYWFGFSCILWLKNSEWSDFLFKILTIFISGTIAGVTILKFLQNSQ